MQKISFISQLLRNKLPVGSEIELHLFELCNLRCHFCGQDHEDKTGFNEILNKINPVVEFIKNNSTQTHILNIMGGEIFNDDLSDAVFDDYFTLAYSINQFAISIGHNCIFNWVTNFIFKKTDRVSQFLQKLKDHHIIANLSTSYDFAGRKNNLWSEDIFLSNLERFKSKIYTIGFVLTRPAIKILMSEDDELFKKLYNNYPLYFDYYVPEGQAKLLMPSDQEMLDAFLFLAQKYPQVSPIKELLENNENKMTCYSLNKLTLLPNGREVKCRYMNYKEGQFTHSIDYLSNDNIIESHINENGCLTCEWYNKCSFRCFVQADWADRIKTDICLFKTFFERTQNHGIDNQADRKM